MVKLATVQVVLRYDVIAYPTRNLATAIRIATADSTVSRMPPTLIRSAEGGRGVD